ncbi:MAG: hypothetical protein U0996_25465 [Planctomycetaceae bacterium]
MDGVVVQAAVDAVSPTLWRTWFESGLSAIHRNDMTAAIRWLEESVRHVSSCGPEDLHRAAACAHLAYAHWRRYEQWEQRASDPCTTETERRELNSLLEGERQKAADAANCSLPILKAAPRSSETEFARARAAHVSGEVHLYADEKNAAAECFHLALREYSTHPGNQAAVNEVLYLVFSLHYQLSEFEQCLLLLNNMEQNAAAANDSQLLARFLAGRAACLIQLGRYRDARRIYDRWRALVPECAAGDCTNYACAYAEILFGRVLLLLGEYPEADRLITAGSCWVEEAVASRIRCGCSISVQLSSLRFDAALLRVESPLCQGDLEYVRDRLADATALNPPWSDRRIQLSLVSGQVSLALGDFRNACRCFLEAKRATEALATCRHVFLIPALLGLSRVDSETSDWAASIQLASQAICLLER